MASDREDRVDDQDEQRSPLLHLTPLDMRPCATHGWHVRLGVTFTVDDQEAYDVIVIHQTGWIPQIVFALAMRAAQKRRDEIRRDLLATYN